MTLADQIANLGYPVGMGIAPRPEAVAAMRAAIIEECARVADDYLAYAEECNEDTPVDRTLIHAYRKVANAIRALRGERDQ